MFRKMPDFKLKLFRDQVDHCLGNVKDVVFELSDAVILSCQNKIIQTEAIGSATSLREIATKITEAQ